MERLASLAADIPAEALYAGEHWAVSRTLPALARGRNGATLWVASAGWGLIPSTARIAPYSATFSTGHPDGVSSRLHERQLWWQELGQWRGPTKAARTLEQLVAEHPRDDVLVVLSEAYYTACLPDLQAAVAVASAPERVSVLAAGVRPSAELARVHLPGDARLQAEVGGSLGALNVRLAAYVLGAGPGGQAAWRNRLHAATRTAPRRVIPQRKRLTDDQVRTFIRQRRHQSPTCSSSRALSDLRAAGMACEQARFAELFTTTSGSKK